MLLKVERRHDLISDFQPSCLQGRNEMSLDGQPRLGFGIVAIVEYQVKGTQRTPRPVFADFAEPPVFNRLPLRSAGWVMTDADGQAQPMRQFLLKLLFKDAASGTIG